MSKKERVRKHIESMQDGARFNVASVAGYLKVTSKDVSNVIAELKRDGIVTGEVVSPHKYMTYTLVQNAVKLKQAVKLKPCNCDPAAIAAGKLHSASCPLYKEPQFDDRLHKTVTKKAPAKRRTPFVMAIDSEIKRMEQRIVLLRKTRREFE